MGVLLWRGFSLDKVMGQCFGNQEDVCGKGRQMPIVRHPWFAPFGSVADRPIVTWRLFAIIFLNLALWLPRAPFSHDFFAFGDTDSSSSWGRLRLEA